MKIKVAKKSHNQEIQNTKKSSGGVRTKPEFRWFDWRWTKQVPGLSQGKVWISQHFHLKDPEVVKMVPSLGCCPWLLPTDCICHFCPQAKDYREKDHFLGLGWTDKSI